MKALRYWLLIAALAVGTAAQAGTSADEPALPDINKLPAKIDLAAPPLNVEMPVENWVLCARAAHAQELVAARGASAERGLEILNNLGQKKQCGRVSEMQVELQKPLFVSWTPSGHKAQAYKALVQLPSADGEWKEGFVIYGIE